jgi:uncharacterized protein
MSKLIFVNLPVADLARSTAFYEAVGATKNPQFSDHGGSCMVFSDAIHVMLLTHGKFSQFTSRPIADARATVQVLLCLSAESREAVDATVARAVSAGGQPDPSPVDEYGWMYGRSFEDPDGHLWGINWMDLAGCAAATGRAA